METLTLRNDEKINLINRIFEIVALIVNWFFFKHRFIKESRKIDWFNSPYRNSTQSRLISIITLCKIQSLIDPNKKEISEKYFIPKFKYRICTKSIIENNQRFIKFSDNKILKIIKYKRFKELIDLPMNPFLEGNASVEWILKELDCDDKIEYILNQPIAIAEEREERLVVEEINDINENNTEVYEKQLKNDKLLPKKFNNSCYFLVNYKENYLKYCNEFPRKLKKPTYSALLLFLHISYVLTNGKEGNYILGRKFSSYEDKFKKLYPNTITGKLKKETIKEFEKSIKRILDGKKELTIAEKQSMAGALVLAKIVGNEKVQQFFKDYQL